MIGLQQACSWPQMEAPNMMLGLVQQTLAQVSSSPGTPSVLSSEAAQEILPTQVDSTQAADTSMFPNGMSSFGQFPPLPSAGAGGNAYGAARGERSQRVEPYAAKADNDPMQSAWEHA